MNNLSLFSTKPSESGYRLYCYEVYNWGTFDQQIWSIKPEGETSLLTGANASGKTTLVDGLLTLLVPEKRMRFYNQTAGSKGERTEDSYVLGEYGETENTDTKSREIKKLRPTKTEAQSILLAVFQNESHFITLAQVRWFSGAQLKRNFIIAHNKLSIQEDFMPFDNSGNWKKRLKQKYPKQGSKDLIHFTDGPGEYGRLMRKAFGIRSEKGHTLFSQTIGLKVLGNLDEFVRQQMLEERDSETEFQKIKNNFKALNDAHRAIEKAHKQIELLSPIRDNAKNLTVLKAEHLRLEEFQEIAPLWFSQTQEQLILDYTQEQSTKKVSLSKDLEEYDNDIAELSNQERELDIQIKNDKVGAQISTLERTIKDQNTKKQEREEELKTYNQLAENLEFQLNPQDKVLFDEQRLAAKKKKMKIKEMLQKNHEEIIGSSVVLSEKNKTFENLSNELSVLRSQKNNITGDTARIRNEILMATGATVDEIPFVGELIKVKKDAQEWESAIERLLHGFALRLIVPEKHYQKVNHYVKDNDLKGRIVYERFKKDEVAPQIFRQYEENALYNKLDFKDSAYTDWITNQITNRFDYLCVDDLEEFRLANKAITKEGLIKNKNRHEKDDRPKTKSRQKYVLGWDNKEKIALLKEEATTQHSKINEVETKLKHLENQQSRLHTEEGDLDKFINFRSHRKIDWWSIAAKIQQNTHKVEELRKTNDRVNTLQNQRKEILAQINSKKQFVEELKKQVYSIESHLETQNKKLRNIKEVIAMYPTHECLEKLESFEKQFMENTHFDINSIEKEGDKFKDETRKALDKLKDQLRKRESDTEKLMRAFINPGKEIIDKFTDWSSDAHRLRENAEFVDEFIDLLERIEGDELAEYKLQFKQYLNEEMITNMSDFQTWLERQEEDIEENIDTLNQSLGKIDFKSNPATFIKLHVEKDYSPKVKDFRYRLNEWKPNLVEFERTKDDRILEESFGKIKALLDNLTEDENFRKDILDVRNWLKFKAVEHHREDPSKIFRSYTGTAKLSGGEGAQLTYTILGSAIAYQFGIHNEGLSVNSFRFICVDEAFSKQDDEKARFLMELCKQLHLQVMVVSPAKAEEVAIVEPYIARVHFVQRKDNRHSVVYDMPIKQLQEQRKEYLQAVE